MGRIARLSGNWFAVSIFAALVFVDLMFVLAHDLHNNGRGFHGYFKSDGFNIEGDGYAELFGYPKEALVVLAFAFLYWTTRQLVYAAWSFTILVVLADDAMQLHERGGDALASFVDRETIFGSSANEVLEPVIWGALAVVVVPTLVVAHRRSKGRARTDSLVFMLLLAGLAVFGGVVDRINGSIDTEFGKETTALGLRTAFEEGGEQAILSAATAFALWCAWREWRARRPPPVASAPDGVVLSLPDGRSVEISAESAQRGFAPAPGSAKTIVCGRCGRTRSGGRWHSLRLSGETREALDDADLLEQQLCDNCHRQMAVAVRS